VATFADHWRRLALAALDLSDPDAQADACGVLARALLEAAAEITVSRQRAVGWRAHARRWHQRYADAARQLAEAKSGVIGVLNQWFPTALAGSKPPREVQTAYEAGMRPADQGRMQ
jgi:hypothetical protein